jgi:hypothetical protein
MGNPLVRVPEWYNKRMGKRGPKPKRPDGYCVDPKGYLRVYRPEGGSPFVHVREWERHHGPVPAGYQIHHKDGNRQNPDIGNLELLTPTDHKRLHSGCERRDGRWWKRCRVCGEFKPIDAEHFYLSQRGYPLYGRCRPCHVATVVADKRLRKMRRAAEDR